MATPVILNGVTFSIPETEDEDWSGSTGVDGYLVALATGVLSKAGGTFTLTAEVDFGATYGVKSAYFKSRGTNPATAGVHRLANAEAISWRNAANGANLDLKVNSSNVLEFNSNPVLSLALGSADYVLRMNAGGTAYEWSKLVDANIDASAAIAYSKLALSNSIVNADVSSSAAIAYSKLNLAASIVNADINSSAAIAYSKLALTGSIVNADVSASAAIAYSKLALTGSIVNADISASAAVAYSKLALTGSIVNADISASAAIAYSKLNLASSIATGDLAAGLLVPISKGGTGQTSKTAAFDALSPNTTSGDLTYHNGTNNVRLAKGTDGQYLKLSSGLPSWADAGGGGSGEINLITNPSAASSASTGWSNGTDHAAPSRLTSGSPLDPQTTTAFRFSKSNTNATTASSTSGAYATFTCPAALKSKKLKVEFYCIIPATGVWTLAVYDGTTRLSLSTDSSSVTTLPAGFTGKFTAYFDTTTNASYTVSFTETSGVVSNLDVTAIIVGPGIQPQGAAKGPLQSWTPTFAGLGTVSITECKWSQDGEELVAYGRVTSGTADSTTLTMTLPNSYTANVAGDTVVGEFYRNNSTASTRKRGALKATAGSNAINFTLDDYTYDASPLGTQSGSNIIGSSTAFTFKLRVPISQFAGAGTVTLASSGEEYLSNSGTWGSSDTTSFAYGPAGASIGADQATYWTMRVRTQTTLQQGETLKVQVSPNGNEWFETGKLNYAATGQPIMDFQYDSISGADSFGIGLERVSNTDWDVRFGRYFSCTTASTGKAGWGTLSGWKWRVIKTRTSGGVIGFGAATSTQSGLLQPVTSMSDALATMLGHKQYLADKSGGSNDVAYNGSNKATISLSSGGGTLSSITRATLIPYKTQDGTWRLRFNLLATVSSAARTSLALAINGVTFKNVNPWYQTIQGQNLDGVVANLYSYTSYGSNVVNTNHSSATTTAYGFSGDVELDSKPTWAY